MASTVASSIVPRRAREGEHEQHAGGAEDHEHRHDHREGDACRGACRRLPGMASSLTARARAPVTSAARPLTSARGVRRIVADVTDERTELERPNPTTRRCPRPTRRFMRQGWGDRELDLPAAPDHRVRRRAAPQARRDVPGRAAGAPGRHLQGAVLRHRLPLPAPTPPTPTSPATRPPTPSSSSTTARRCSTPGRARTRDTDEFFRDRHVRRAVGRPPAVAAGDLRVARPRGAPHRRPAGGPAPHRQDPRPPRRVGRRRRAGVRATTPATATSPG